MIRYRLVVYPPGISEPERRRVRAARGWPLWGVLVWLISEVWLNQLTGPWEALAISTAIYLGLGLVTRTMAGEQRTQVRTLGAAVMLGHHDPVSTATVDKLKGLAASLIEADRCLCDGRLSSAEYELIWWGVYDAIGSGRSAATAA